MKRIDKYKPKTCRFTALITMIIRIKCTGLPDQKNLINHLESWKFKIRINERELSILTEKETTISREKSSHYDPEKDDEKGDIVRLTVRSEEEFSVVDFKDHL